MYKNYINTGKKSMKSIMVTNDNEVVVKVASGNIDEKKVMRTVSRKKYQLVSTLKVGDTKLAHCANSTGTDWYNLTLCKKIISLKKGESVRIEAVAGEAFLKVIDADEKFAYIYDATGNLIAQEKEPIKIDVVFSGVGACLQKTNEQGDKTLYTFEGYLVG